MRLFEPNEGDTERSVRKRAGLGVICNEMFTAANDPFSIT